MAKNLKPSTFKIAASIPYGHEDAYKRVVGRTGPVSDWFVYAKFRDTQLGFDIADHYFEACLDRLRAVLMVKFPSEYIPERLDFEVYSNDVDNEPDIDLTHIKSYRGEKLV